MASMILGVMVLSRGEQGGEFTFLRKIVDDDDDDVCGPGA